jgi:hypothetical protein
MFIILFTSIIAIYFQFCMMFLKVEAAMSMEDLLPKRSSGQWLS